MKRYLKIKTFIAVVVLIGGVWSAWQIGAAQNKKNNQVSIKAEVVDGNDSNLDFETTSSLAVGLPTIAGSETDPQSDNLTDNLAQLYTQQIINRNAAGPTTDSNGQSQITVPSENVFDDLLQQNLGQTVQYKEFTLDDLIVSADNSSKNQISYIQALNSITQKNLGNANIFAALDKLLNQNDPSVMQNQMTAVSNQISDVLQIPIPSLWQQFDLEALNLWQKTATIYQAFLGINNDPLKTYLVLNDFQNVLQETQSLNTVLTNRYQDLTLKK